MNLHLATRVPVAIEYYYLREETNKMEAATGMNGEHLNNNFTDARMHFNARIKTVKPIEIYTLRTASLN